MAKEPQEAFDLIRKQLQLILIRAESCQDSGQCRACTAAVGEIVREIRSLEALVGDLAAQRGAGRQLR